LPNKEYLQGSENAVLQALQITSTIEKPWVSISDLKSAEGEVTVSIPVTPVDDRYPWPQGGHTVFDFNDRLLRTLKRLEKRNLVKVQKRQGRWSAKLVE